MSNSVLNPSLWLSKYGDYLYSYCLYRINHPETAEDLVQETFVSAFKAKDTFGGQSSERTWLVAILKNKIIDHYRKKDPLKNTEEYLSSTESEFSDHFFNPHNGHWNEEAAPGHWAPAADATLENSEFNAVLQACITKMPSKLMPVFIAKFIDDEDSEKICKEHKLSPSNYWVIIHRAKVLMRSCLEKNWFVPTKS